MSFIRNFFRRSSIKDTELKEGVRLEIFVDSFTSRTKDPITLTVKKNMTIRDLRHTVASMKRIDSEQMVLLINLRFWDDEKTVEDFMKDMGVCSGAYIVYAVVISEADEATIDYDIEKHLKDKYSSAEIAAQDFVITDNDGINLETEEVVAVPVVCSHCQISKARKEIIILDYCRHEFCKDCLSSIVNASLGKSAKCPQTHCERCLLDHDIQKILGAVEYNKWQILIQRKSAGDSAFIIPKMGWICDTCTFLNKPFHKFCDTCNDNRSIDYQIPIFYEPSDEEKLIQKEEDEERKKVDKEMKQQEKEKNIRLEALKNLSKQSVTFTYEITQCPICVMDYDPGEAIILHSCLHTICKDCLTNYLLNIEDALVKCPTENCIGLVEDREIISILSPEQYQKYEDLNLRMAEAKEKFSFHCKEVNCTAWIINEGNVDKFKCLRCASINCIKCETIHKKETCQEYQMTKAMASLDPNQSKNDLYIQGMINAGEAMKCPGCGVIVEKNRGCDGVLCRNCGMMICWATKGPRWGPKGKGDRSGGCGCRFLWGRRCHPNCHYCH